MKSILVFSFLWSVFAGAIHSNGNPPAGPNQRASNDPACDVQEVFASRGTVIAFNDIGIGTIQDQNGQKIRASAHDMLESVKKGDVVTFEQVRIKNVWHAQKIKRGQ